MPSALQPVAPSAANAGYRLTALGPVTVWGADGRPRPLSPARKHLLAHLIATGPAGLAAADLIVAPTGLAIEPGPLRMSMARLRDHLTEQVLPQAVGGRYRLDLAAEDVDVWHLFELLHADDLSRIDARRLHRLLLPAPPYGDVPTSTLVDEHAARVQVAQLELASRVAATRPDLVTAELADGLAAHATWHRYDERALCTAASVLAAAGQRRRAANLLHEGADDLRSIGIEPSTALLALQQRVLDPGAVTAVAPPARSSRLELPPALAQLRTFPLVGDGGTLNALDVQLLVGAPPLVALVGPPGSGTSRLLAEVAALAVARGTAVVHCAASPFDDVALGPLVAALPELRTSLGQALAGDLDPAERRAAVWLAATEALGARTGPAGLLLMVEDLQWADGHLLDLVIHLSARADDSVRVLLAGSGALVEPETWAAIGRRLEAARAAVIQLPPLGPEAFGDLVAAVRPDLDGRRAAHLGHELHQLTGGRPGPAMELLLRPEPDPWAAADLGHAPVTARDVGVHVPSTIDALDDTGRLIAATVAVLGPRCVLDDLVEVAGVDVHAVLDRVDQLVRRGLLAERSAVEFEIPTVEVRSVLAAAVIGGRRRALHLRAADHFATDVPRRARHLAAAVPLVDARVAIDALMASARERATAGRYREAVVDHELAAALGGVPTQIEDLATLVRALALSGDDAHATDRRNLWVQRLVEEGDHAGALAVATSALPEFEPLDGDPSLLALLESIDGDALPVRARGELLRHLARQTAIAGRTDDALRYADGAARLAVDPAERVGAAIVRRWTVWPRSDPAQRLAIVGPVADVARSLGAAHRAEIDVLLAVDRYEAGDAIGVDEVLADLEAVGTLLPTLRRWHLALFRALLAADSGRLEDAAALRRAAHRLGTRAGFAEADIALIGAEFTLRWLLTGEAILGRSSSAARAAAGGPAASALGLAALALAMDHGGDAGGAAGVAEDLAAGVLRSPVSGGVPALALVAHLLPTESPVRAPAAALLETRGESLLLVGAGSVSLGPVARYLAHLVPDRAEQGRLRDVAIALADRSGALLWRAVTRRDAVRAGTASAATVAELADLVDGTELHALAGA